MQYVYFIVFFMIFIYANEKYTMSPSISASSFSVTELSWTMQRGLIPYGPEIWSFSIPE